MFPVAAELSAEQLEKARILKALKQWRVRRDYKYFLSEALGYDFPEFHDPTTQHLIQEVGDFAKDWMDTRHSQQTYRKLMCIWPRGTGKSAVVTKTLPIWSMLDDPDVTWGVMSATFESMAVKFTGSMKQILGGEDRNSKLLSLMDLKFHDVGSQRKWTDDRFTIDLRGNTSITDPTVSAFSAAKGPTSGHFKGMIVDDPVTHETMSGDARWLDKIWDSYLQLPAVIDKDGLLVVINTRYHDADLCGRIIAEEIKPEVERVMGGLPSDWDDEKGWIKYAHIAGWKVLYEEVYEDFGTDEQRPRFPVIWPEERIEATRNKGAKSDLFFWTQLMNQPQKREDNPIQPIHVKTAMGSPEPWKLDEAPRTGRVNIYCDFAFKDAEAYAQQRGDFTVAHVCTHRDGFVWRVNGYRGKPTQDQFGDELIRLALWAKNELGARVDYLDV